MYTFGAASPQVNVHRKKILDCVKNLSKDILPAFVTSLYLQQDENACDYHKPSKANIQRHWLHQRQLRTRFDAAVSALFLFVGRKSSH